MEVILAGIKNQTSKEFRAGTVIVFASLIPRIRLNPKAAKKIMRSLAKVENKDIETLSMLALLFRCQANVLDPRQVMDEFVKNKGILQGEVFSNVQKRVDEDQEFARRLLKTLALLCQKVLNELPAPDQLMTDFLGFLLGCLKECLPSAETAEILIVCISRQFGLWKGQKGEEHGKQCVSLCKKILDVLRRSFEEEYSRKCTLQQESDILFIEGVDNPTTQMIDIKRTLLDNTFVQAMTAVILDIDKDTVKSNRQAVKMVLEGSTSFLHSQMTSNGLRQFCLNVLDLYPKKLKMAKEAISHIHHLDSVSETTETEVEDMKIDANLLILQLLFTPIEKNQEMLNDIALIIKEEPKASLFSSSATKLPMVAKLLPTLSIVLTEESKSIKIIKRLYEKVSQSADSEDLCKFSQVLIESEHHRNETLFTLAVLLFKDKITAEKKNSDETDKLVLQFVKLILAATKWIPIKATSKECLDNDDANAADHKLLTFAHELKAIPSMAMKVAIQSLCNNREDCQRHNLLVAMIGGVWQSKNVDPSLVETVTNFLKNQPDFSSALLATSSLEIFSHFGTGDDTPVEDIIKHLHLLALEALTDVFDKRTDVVKKSMSFESQVIPGLMGGLWSPSKKVRKKTIKCFQKALEKPVARANYAPLLKIVIAHKEAVLANPDNLVDAMKNFQEENRSFNAIMLALVETALGTNELLIALCKMFKYVESKSLIAIALHLTELLAKVDHDSLARKTLEAVLANLGSSLIRCLDETPVWDFFESGLRSLSLTMIQHNGLDKSVACAVIDTMIHSAENEEEILNAACAPSLCYALIELSKEDNVTAEHLASARKLLQNLLSEKAKISLLTNIWGDGFFGPSATNKKKALSISDEVSKWRMTNFYLETIFHNQLGQADLIQPLSLLLKRALQQNNQTDHSYSLDLLISSLLEITNTLKPEVKEDNPMDTELVVQCIRGCADPNTKALALMLLAKSTVSSNIEYILHNSIQLFTFVGSHFLQMESKASFDIACTAIDVLVPHILKAAESKHQVEELSVTILETFVDASSDMPRHRFCIFMQVLLNRLGAEEYLWLLTLLLTKAEARKKHYDIVGSQKSSKLTTEEKCQQLIDLYAMFGHQPGLLLKSLTRMIQQTKSCNKSIQKLLSIAEGNKASVEEMFDNVRIRMLAFIHKLFGSAEFLRSIVQGLQISDNDSEVRDNLQSLLECIVVTMDCQGEGTKYRRQLGNFYEKVFEAVLALIPTTYFAAILAKLISLRQPSNIQRKALEVLNARLNQQEQIYEDDLDEILEALTTLIENKNKNVSAVNQQIALLCMKTLAKALTANNQDSEKMMEVCTRISAQTVLESFKQDPVIGAGILCITHVLECLGMKAVIHLKSFVSWLLNLMDRQVVKSIIVLNSLVVSMQKIMDRFAGFLNPYYQRIIVASCQLSAWHQGTKTSVSELEYRQCGHRLKQLHSALSNGIPFHVLLKLAPLAYRDTKTDSPVAIIALAGIMADNVNNVNKVEILSSASLAMEFFMEAFKYRQEKNVNINLVDDVEEALVATFLAFGLKLSLDDFKPLFYKLFNLALDNDNLEGISTVFHISSLVAQKLKSLFNFVSEMIVQKATGILQNCKDKTDEPSATKKTMLTLIFEALAAIFKYNRVDSLLMKSYEDHVNALLEHLDGTIHEDVFLDKLRECLGELAATTEDETQWKYLNYQVLMLIRNQNSKVNQILICSAFFIGR